LRQAEIDASSEQQRSPRVSSDWEEGEIHVYAGDHITANGTSSLVNGHQDQKMNHSTVQNGTANGSVAEDGDMADAEGEDGLDEDDLMDKISSSPSIDDGAYSKTSALVQKSQCTLFPFQNGVFFVVVMSIRLHSTSPTQQHLPLFFQVSCP
jgi:hypothetical protein